MVLYLYRKIIKRISKFQGKGSRSFLIWLFFILFLFKKKSGWWFKDCLTVNLNGMQWQDENSGKWIHIQRSQMALRRKPEEKLSSAEDGGEQVDLQDLLQTQNYDIRKKSLLIPGLGGATIQLNNINVFPKSEVGRLTNRPLKTYVRQKQHRNWDKWRILNEHYSIYYLQIFPSSLFFIFFSSTWHGRVQKTDIHLHTWKAAILRETLFLRSIITAS